MARVLFTERNAKKHNPYSLQLQAVHLVGLLVIVIKSAKFQNHVRINQKQHKHDFV